MDLHQKVLSWSEIGGVKIMTPGEAWCFSWWWLCLFNGSSSLYCWWFRNPAITSWGEGSGNPIIFRLFLHPFGGCFGDVFHQPYPQPYHLSEFKLETFSTRKGHHNLFFFGDTGYILLVAYVFFGSLAEVRLLVLKYLFLKMRKVFVKLRLKTYYWSVFS